MSDSVRSHRRQPTRLPRLWDSPGKNTGVGCHFLLQCMKVKSESEVAQSCPTLATPWTAAYQAPPSMGFARQEYWSGMPLPSLNHIVNLYKILLLVVKPDFEVCFFLNSSKNCSSVLSVTSLWANRDCYRRRQWHPTPILLPGKSHGWRSLVGCSP